MWIFRRQGKFALHPITKLAHPDNAVWRTPLIILLNGETLEKLLDLKISMCEFFYPVFD